MSATPIRSRPRVIEADGRLAFTNDTAYEVITRGNPNNVDMVLVLVQPPPDLVDEGAADWRTWVETPVHVVWANLIPNEPERWLRVAYYQSTIEGCARPGNEDIQVNGRDIIVRVTLNAAAGDRLGHPLRRGGRGTRHRAPHHDAPRTQLDLPRDRQRPRNHQLRAARDRPPRHVHRGVPLGADFEPGAEYTVVVNADTSVVFVADAP